jgi:hypothetical protein
VIANVSSQSVSDPIFEAFTWNWQS